MLIFLFTLRITSLSFAYLFDSRHAAAAVTGLVLLPLSLVAGYVVQFRDLSAWVGWLTYVSPHYWEVFNSPHLNSKFLQFFFRRGCPCPCDSNVGFVTEAYI